MAIADLPFRKLANAADLDLWRNLNEHVDMIRFEIPLQDLAIFLTGQSVKDLAKPGTNAPVQSVLPHLGNEDDMILAVPLGVGKTVVRLRHIVFPFAGTALGKDNSTRRIYPDLRRGIFFYFEKELKVKPCLVTLVELVASLLWGDCHRPILSCCH